MAHHETQQETFNPSDFGGVPVADLPPIQPAASESNALRYSIGAVVAAAAVGGLAALLLQRQDRAMASAQRPINSDGFGTTLGEVETAALRRQLTALENQSMLTRLQQGALATAGDAKAQLSEAVDQASGVLSEAYEDASERFSLAYEEASEWARDAYIAGQRAAGRAGQVVAERYQESPVLYGALAVTAIGALGYAVLSSRD